jgi:hypothetical protein
VEGGWGVLSLHLEKSSTLTPLKNFGPKIGKFGQKMALFGNFLTNPGDFQKSAVKFHDIF